MRRIDYPALARALGFRDWNELQEDYINQLANPHTPDGRDAQFRALAEATKRCVSRRSKKRIRAQTD